MGMKRLGLIVAALMWLSACAQTSRVVEPPVDLGNFSLELNYVFAGKAQTSAAVSREVSEEALSTALTEAIDARFRRYKGTERYHLGVSVEGYILARAGVPVVAAPKSAMIILVTVWDADQETKLNEPPKQMTILEDLDGEALIGTGWTQDADTQLDELAFKAAKAIEDFLLEQNIQQGWFMPEGYVPPEPQEETADTATR